MKSWNKVLLASMIGLLAAGCDEATKASATPDKTSAEPMKNGAATEEDNNSMGEQPQETDGANDPAGKPVSP
ncbi:hypothetical protein [Serratia oryzae]|uniref:hypothetical protein n=1 Tax=Serratia oryzae TaxID=2034155 RepID=UPI0012E22419|nr:hypothetical protein [Serratia oryzae]VXC95828.1 conserved exported hypothetical protein [Enterobacterales bacterium 8AC]